MKIEFCERCGVKITGNGRTLRVRGRAGIGRVRGITLKADEIIYRIQAKYVESIGYQEEGTAK